MHRAHVVVGWLLASLSLGRAHALPPAEELRSLYGDRVERLIARGDARRAAGDVISALGYYRDAIHAAPRRSEGYLALGALHLALAEPARALEVFEAAIRAQAADAALSLRYAETLQALGHVPQALNVLRRVVEAEPQSSEALAALAEAVAARGAFIEALAARRARVEVLRAGAEGVGAGVEASANASASANTSANTNGNAELEEERAQVRALERIVGGVDRARSPGTCSEADAGSVLRALARCR